jgi:hypothetical protein
MKKSEFKEFVKEMFLELIENDEEVREVILEFAQKNLGMISESKQLPKEPSDPELYDKLMLIASGQESKMIYEGKTIKTPNYGTGFKSSKHIKEWTNGIYSKIGGKWSTSNSNLQQNGVSNDTLSFLSAMGGAQGGADIRNVGSSGNDKLIMETIRRAGHGTTIGVDENGNIDSGRAIDITSILADTARTTSQNFPSSHEGGAQAASRMAGGQESFQGAPEKVFAESAGNWAALAFHGMGSGK